MKHIYPLPLFCLLFLCVSTNGFAQQGRFSLLKGNSQEILTTHLDRDSSMLFTMDKAGDVVVWDINSMWPIRRFTTVPLHIGRDASPLEHNVPFIGASKTRVWVTHLSPVGTGRNGVYDIYNRVSGKHTFQSDTSTLTERIHGLRNDGFIQTKCLQRPIYHDGKMVYGYLLNYPPGSNEAKQEFLYEQATALQVSDDEKYIAVGYKWGGVDVFELATLKKVMSSKPDESDIGDQVFQIRFLKGNKGIVYSYFMTGSQNFYQHELDQKTPKKITFQNHRSLRLEVSPSGKYLLVYNKFDAGIYDLEKQKFSSESLKSIMSINLNAASFLTDDIILLAGATYANYTDLYSSGIPEKAALLKVNWQTGNVSVNRSYDALNSKFLTSELSTLNDSTFKLSEADNFSHIVSPGQLKNTFATGRSVQGTLVTDDALPAAIWYVQDGSEQEIVLAKADAASVNFTTPVAKIRKIKSFRPARIHSTTKTILWKPEPGSRSNAFILSDFKGSVILKDSTDQLYRSSVAFSPDGKWLSYLRNTSDVVVVQLQQPKRPKVYKTGLLNTQYMPNKLQFNQTSTALAFQTFESANLEAFTLSSVTLATGDQKSLSNFGVRPYSYALNPDFTKIALSFPLHFADTKLFGDQAELQKAALYGFRNVYNPVIYLLDLKANSMTTFPVAQKQQVAQMAITSDRVIALQKDGLLYHYTIKDTTQVYIQWLKGHDQVILGSDFYYATAGAVNSVTYKVGNSYFPVGEQDRFFNQPHRVMQVFGNKNNAMLQLYELAHKKRIRQTNQVATVADKSQLPVLSIDPAVTKAFYTQQSELTFKVTVDKPGSVKKVLVSVNGSAVYGKGGFTVPAGKQEITLTVPLDPGTNDILVQGLDVKNQYMKPLKLDYFASYTVTPTKKTLWVLSAGVSQYADSTYNLKYAAKDALDFVKVFSYKDNFDTVIVKTLVNKQVSTKAFLNEIKSASNLGKNDVVLVYLAGHGLLDPAANFYFATHEMDFNDPAKKGLAYEEIMSAMESLPVKNKALFMDACHSGLLDRSQFRSVAEAEGARSVKILPQSTRGVSVKNAGKNQYKEQDVFLFMQQVFSNLSQDNNVNVLSASLGNSYALENDSLQNGVFTYSLIKGIGLAQATGELNKQKADRLYAEGSLIELQDIANYLAKEVVQLSRGAQTPTFTLSQTANQIMFKESDIASLYIYDSDYKPFDMKEYKPSKATQYRNFLDRYKATIQQVNK